SPDFKKYYTKSKLDIFNDKISKIQSLYMLYQGDINKYKTYYKDLDSNANISNTYGLKERLDEMLDFYQFIKSYEDKSTAVVPFNFSIFYNTESDGAKVKNISFETIQSFLSASVIKLVEGDGLDFNTGILNS